MSIRFRIRVVRHGMPLEIDRESSANQTLGDLIHELTREGVIYRSDVDVVVAVVRNSVIGENHTVGELFAQVPEGERLIEFWLVGPALRDMLETMAAAREAEQEDDLSDEDLDDDEIDNDRSAPVAAPSPAPPAMPQPIPPRVSLPGAIGLPARGRVGASESVREEVVSRRATVRHYDRMNPQKVFPFMVSLTSEKVKKLVQKRISQSETGPFEVKLDEFVQIEPILPGCTCYPARAELMLTAADTAVHFWVVPQVLGKVKGAKVTVCQQGRRLAEIELDIRVRRTTLAIVVALATLLYPFIAAIAKQFGIDFSNLGQLGQYLSVVNEFLRAVSPLAIFIGLLTLTGVLYWWSRPRERDQFWDLEPEPGRR